MSSFEPRILLSVTGFAHSLLFLFLRTTPIFIIICHCIVLSNSILQVGRTLRRLEHSTRCFYANRIRRISWFGFVFSWHRPDSTAVIYEQRIIKDGMNFEMASVYRKSFDWSSKQWMGCILHWKNIADNQVLSSARVNKNWGDTFNCEHFFPVCREEIMAMSSTMCRKSQKRRFSIDNMATLWGQRNDC